MFEGDYTINGIHATYIKYLVNEVKAFERYIDVYMAGATIGVLNDRRTKQGGTTDRARIYSDAFNTEHVKCNELFRIVILNDISKPWSDEERVNICFKYREKMDERAVPSISEHELEVMKEALDLFNEYVMGGIELLYENFSSSATVSIDDTVDYAYKAIFDQHTLIESRQVGASVNQLLRPEY
jgi:hypothetical protein